MAEAKELQLSIIDDQDSNETNTNGHTSCTTLTKQPPPPSLNHITLAWWLRIAAYSLFLLGGQASATLLGRLYFEKGGNSQWLQTLVQVSGFPFLLPYYFMILTSKYKNRSNPPKAQNIKQPPRYSKPVIASIYIVLGLIIALSSYLFTIGLNYIPVSTLSLICASQLTFNAFFSYFINKQKFTPYIINSLVILTISSVLLAFNSSYDNDARKESKAKYVIGFICTIVASAGFSLLMSLTQYFITKVLRSDDFRTILDVTFLTAMVASLATMAGLFASGDWAHLGREMEGYKMGKVSYVMNLAWTAVTWQLYSVGNIGLIMEVSALFSKALSVLGLPVIPVCAVFLFGEKMNGIKAIAMVLAIWGFVSYVYQKYLDSQVTKEESSKLEAEPLEIG